MPLYEYECDANLHRFEKIQKFSDGPVETCPVCGSAVRRLVSSPAIQFKGSGWYITDYARAGKSDGAKAESTKNGEAASSSSSESSTDSSSTLQQAQGRPDPSTGSGPRAESRGQSRGAKSSESASETKSESKTTKTESTPSKA